MTDTRNPRYMRTVGLTLLAALLVVASCEVEQPTTIAASTTAIQADLPAIQEELPVIEEDPPAVRDEPPTTQAVPQEIRPEEGPVFTPMTVRPEVRNRTEAQAALMREYPVALRDAGIGGTVIVWFFITEEGTVQDTRVSQSSGQVQLDQAAVRVAEILQFTPALNRGDPVPVWIQLPITFAVL